MEGCGVTGPGSSGVTGPGSNGGLWSDRIRE